MFLSLRNRSGRGRKLPGGTEGGGHGTGRDRTGMDVRGEVGRGLGVRMEGY